MIRVVVNKSITARTATENSENPLYSRRLDSTLTLRKIARTIANYFNIDVDFSTIYRWIQEYMSMVSEYVNSFAPPQLSTTWHADELFVKVKGGTHKAILELGLPGTSWTEKPAI